MPLGTWGGSEGRGPRSSAGAGSEIGSPSFRTAREELTESPEGSYTIPRIYSGAFSRTSVAGSGNQTITGIPFKPYMVFFFAAGTTEMNVGGASFGFAFDPALGFATPIASLFRLTGTAVYWGNSANALRLREVTVGPVEWTGDIESMQPDGFVFTWTEVGVTSIGADVQFTAYGRG